MNKVRRYRIICLKRSTWPALETNGFTFDWYENADLVYWMPNCRGYTTFKDEAGHYTLAELENAGGSHGDWLVEPVWVEE